MNVKPRSRILFLRNRILHELGGKFFPIWLRSLTWIPHISIAYDAWEEGARVAAFLSPRLPSITLECNTLVLRDQRERDLCFELGSGKLTCLPAEDGGMLE